MKTIFTSMKTRLTTLGKGSRTCSMTWPVPGRKPVLALSFRLLWAAALVLPASGAQAGVIFTNLYSFTGANDGGLPYAGLVQGSDGYFYGTTDYGGTNNLGTVFKISANGALTSLYSFTGGADGAYPLVGLVQGSDGYFYGTTAGHGPFFYPCAVFKISTNGALTPLYTFSPPWDEIPSGLVQGSDGNFYGTTYGGGTYNRGSVFQISTNGALTNLYSFSTFSSPGGLVQGSDGSFYGTTRSGGNTNLSDGYGFGMVFKVTTNGTLTSLYSFTGTNDGANPQAALVQGSDGNFYGTTQQGGTNRVGTVFEINTNGVLASLYSFTGTNDGANPQATLVQGSDGSFYGTTAYGGTNNYGTVFKINTNGALITLYSFTGGNDGGTPYYAGLVQGSDGSFYGTTLYGGVRSGVSGVGTVFRLTVLTPQLTITPSGANVILSWPTNYVGFITGFTLGFATNLASPAVWQTNSTAPVVIGGQNVITNPVTGSQMFFRLSSP